MKHQEKQESLLLLLGLTLLLVVFNKPSYWYPPVTSSANVYEDLLEVKYLPLGNVKTSYTSTWELTEGVSVYTERNPILIL